MPLGVVQGGRENNAVVQIPVIGTIDLPATRIGRRRSLRFVRMYYIHHYRIVLGLRVFKQGQFKFIRVS